jgi:hypothetical protein
MATNYVPPIHPVPRDEEDSGYIKSFKLEQEEDYIQVLRLELLFYLVLINSFLVFQ